MAANPTSATPTRETEIEIIEAWMRHLTTTETLSQIIRRQEELRQLQMDLLLEVAQMHMGVGVAAGVEGETRLARKKRLNVSLSLIEIYLLILHCCILKVNYFRSLLDPSSYDADIMERLPRQMELEQIVDLEFYRAHRLIESCPEVANLPLLNLRRDEAPFKLLCMPVLAPAPAP